MLSNLCKEKVKGWNPPNSTQKTSRAPRPDSVSRNPRTASQCGACIRDRPVGSENAGQPVAHLIHHVGHGQPLVQVIDDDGTAPAHPEAPPTFWNERDSRQLRQTEANAEPHRHTG